MKGYKNELAIIAASAKGTDKTSGLGEYKGEQALMTRADWLREKKQQLARDRNERKLLGAHKCFAWSEELRFAAHYYDDSFLLNRK